MAVPEEGPLHLGKIAKEFVYDNYDSTSTQPTNVSLKNLSTHAADGGFDAVNTASFLHPDGSVEHSMGEFYEYDHDFSTEPLYVTYTLRYSSSTSTVCEASTVTVDADFFQDWYKTDPVKSGLDIYEDTSSSLNGAAQGWYSNGTEKRYWTGSSWYGIQNCGSSSDPNSTTNEAFTLNSHPWNPWTGSDFHTVQNYVETSNVLKATGTILTEKYYRFQIRYNSIGDHALIVDSNENVYTGGGLFNSDDKNFKPVIGLRDKYGEGGIFNSNSPALGTNNKQIYTAWNWGEGISNLISDMCWIDNNGTPTHIFWVDCHPGNSYIVPIQEFFRFGAVKNATQTKSSITHPELFQFEHFTKVLEQNPDQTPNGRRIWFSSRFAKPSVASTYNSVSYCYVAGQINDSINQQNDYKPFIYRIQYTNQTAAAGTSSNIWSNGQFKIWEEGDSTFKNMFKDIDANSTQVVAVGSKQSEGIAVITNTGSTYSKHLHFGGTHTIAHGVKVSGSNIYICGITGTSSGKSQYKAFLIKTNGSTLTWKKIYKLNLFGTGEDTDSYVWKQIAIDSSDNIYVATQQEFRNASVVPDDIYYEGGHFDQKDNWPDNSVNTATDDFRISIAKFNSSGTLQWIKRININSAGSGDYPSFTKCKGISSLYIQGSYLYAGFSFDKSEGTNAGHDYFKIRASDGDISTGSFGNGFSVTAATMSSGTALNTYTDYSSDSFSFTAYTNGSGNWNTVAQNSVLQLSATGGDISDTSYSQQWGVYGYTNKVS